MEDEDYYLDPRQIRIREIQDDITVIKYHIKSAKNIKATKGLRILLNLLDDTLKSVRG